MDMVELASDRRFNRRVFLRWLRGLWNTQDWYLPPVNRINDDMFAAICMLRQRGAQ